MAEAEDEEDVGIEYDVVEGLVDDENDAKFGIENCCFALKLIIGAFLGDIGGDAIGLGARLGATLPGSEGGTLGGGSGGGGDLPNEIDRSRTDSKSASTPCDSSSAISSPSFSVSASRMGRGSAAKYSFPS